MRFKGDIIITDPCYICKEKEQVGEYPKRDDYFTYGTDIEKYPDAVREVIDISKECPEMIKVLEQIDKVLGYTDPEYRKKHPRTHYVSKIYEECNKKYKEALNKYYELNKEEWEKSKLGENMEVLGIHTYISRDTLYGDWSCTTYNSDTKEKLGEFCADVGGVAVFLLDEVLKYNPDYDDYITKPFSLMALVSKVNALMRRLSKVQAQIMSYGEITVHMKTMQVYKGDEPVTLSKKEFSLLLYLWENAGQIVSKESILEHVWDIDGQFVDDNTVTVNISRLKNKLGTEEIANVRGLG